MAAYYVVSREPRQRRQARPGDLGERRRSSRAGELVVVEVVDDGVGGADTERGSGLRGLADRVEALGGRLRVWTPRRRHARAGGDAVRVVIAEDSVLLREGLARLLADAGFDVVGAVRRRRRAAAQGAQLRARRRRSSTSGCRRPTPTRGCGPRSRSARRHPRRRARALAVRRARPGDEAARRLGRGRRLPAQGPDQRRRRVPRRGPPGGRRRLGARPDHRLDAALAAAARTTRSRG